MRRGRVFRRCTRCGGEVTERRCTKCDSTSATWAFRVDVQAPGLYKRRQVQRGGFATKAEAVAAMAAELVERETGTFVEPSKLTVDAYLDQWVRSGCGGVRGSTLTGYAVCVRRHIVPRIGAISLQSLTRVHVKALYEDLARSGNAHGGGLSVKSVHNVHVCLRTALEAARADGLIRTNPADRAHRKPSDRPEMLTWTEEELRTFLDQVAGERDYAMWRTLAATGMRRGELLALRVRDLDLASAQLHVRQQRSRQRDGALTFSGPKTRHGVRTIDLDQATVRALGDRLQAQAFERRAWGAGYREDLDLVFCHPDGSPYDPDVVTHRFEAAAVGAGLRRIRLHDVRHTVATLLLAEGADAKTVSERMGHANVAITLDLYQHVIPKSRAGAASKMGALLDECARSVHESDSQGVGESS